MNSGYDYLRSNKAILEADYPYTAKQGACQAANIASTDVSVSLFNYVTPYDGSQIKAALATGPVGVAINGGSLPFQFYREGIFNCDYVTCGNEASDLNHAVLLVGYGTEGSTEYFILKNQWAETWGE